MKYLEEWANLKEANRILLIIIALLLSFILGLIGLSFYMLSNRQIVVYMPPYETVKVSGRDYVLLWARVFTEYLTNFDPETANPRFRFLSIYAYGDIKQKLLRETESIVRNRISQQFLPFEGSWELNPRKREIKVKGRLKKWVGSKQIENRIATFFLYMRIIDGKPLIVGFRYE